jgi:DNA-binding response OmpR family regulator
LHRVLIVDDDVDSAELLAILLQVTGRGETQPTRLGTTAVALAVGFAATIAFIDLKLPGTTWPDGCTSIRYCRNCDLIALSDEHSS